MPDRVIRRRRSVGSVGVRARRHTEWFASADVATDTGLGAATKVFDQSLTTAEKAKRPFTVVRVRGELWVASDQQVASEEPFGALGFAVVSDTAAALGVTAVPDPITDEASDLWFVHQFWQTGLVFLSGVGVSGSWWDRYSFDSRAMRKVQEGEDIAVVLANASSTSGALYILKFRLLVKLH